MYDTYADIGNMYVIVPKKPRYTGEKYQLLIYHSGTLGDLMNERDEEVDYIELYDMYPEIPAAIDSYRNYLLYGRRTATVDKYMLFEYDKYDQHQPFILTDMPKSNASSILVEGVDGKDHTVLVILERQGTGLGYTVALAHGTGSDAIRMLIRLGELDLLPHRSFYYAGLYALYLNHPEDVLEIVPHGILRRAARSKHTTPEFKKLLPPEILDMFGSRKVGESK